MAIAVVMDFEGGNAEGYDGVVSEMGLTGQPASAIAGLIFHAAGPTPTGWRVVDVWESPADLEGFQRERLFPATEKVGGMPRPPQVQVTTVHAMQR